MRTIFYILFILYVIYIVNRFLARFYFQKFSNSQQDILNELLKQQQRAQEKQRSKEGEIKLEKSRQASKDRGTKSGEGDYVDYEVVN